MLQKQAVKEELLELLTNLQAERELQNCRLVGGTSLALQLAHRKSTDIDLFTVEPFDFDTTFALLVNNYGLKATRTNQHTIVGFIDGIKVDVIHHPFRWLQPPILEKDFRLASINDIAAMKMHAVTNSGQRPKDYLDIAFLSSRISYNKLKELTLEKYPAYNPIMFDKAIIYFDDIDRDSINKIEMLGYEMKWKAIEDRLLRMTDRPDTIFLNPPLKKIEAPKKKRGLYL